jgi:hypothetical protein
MEKEIYDIEMFGVSSRVKLDYASYGCNGTLALQLMCQPDEDEMGYYAQFGGMSEETFVSPYGVATVNLPDSRHLPPDEQFVDENNLPGIGDWLQRNNIAKPTGQVGFSGYCRYPVYKFNAPREALENMIRARQETARKNGPPLGDDSRGQHKRH